MADVEHSSLTGSSLHEPKGVASATASTLYVADGSGSGSWAKISSGSINTSSSIFNVNKYHVTVEIPDISTADVVLVPCPNACVLNKVTTILHGAIITADSILTLTNSTGPTTIGTITVAFTGSAEGDRDTLSPSSNNTFTAGSYLKIANDGGSANTVRVIVFLEFTRTA